jgi:MOSC domain-containing protein YiiM
MKLDAASQRPYVAAVSAAKKHTFSKQRVSSITTMAGLGIQGDAHCGAYVQHLYDKARDPARPNLRQVHLVEEELIEDVKALGFDLTPGQLGENITTRHLNLFELQTGSVLQLGTDARIQITGLRQPCAKIDRFQHGLRKAITTERNGQSFMKGAVMAVVISGGTISAGDIIQIFTPATGLGFPLRNV